jgi:hypothetical protein
MYAKKIRNIFVLVNCKRSKRGKKLDKSKQNVARSPFRTTALLGVLLLVIGIFLLNHSIYTIQDNEQPLNSVAVPLEQMSNYDGSLSWWKKAYENLFLPLTSVFLTLSGIILSTQPIITAIQRKKELKNLPLNVKQSPEKHLQPELTQKASS